MPTVGLPPGADAGTPRRRGRFLVAGVGAALVAAGASWAVVASSATRLPGGEITGRILAPEAVTAALQTALDDETNNDIVGAMKQYQKVLDSDPQQVQALTGEGWLLSETGQPVLLQKGLGLLVRAETAQPAYAPAHVYRGIALLGEDDYADAIPELEWYLAHDPDPKLEPEVQKALTQAKRAQAAATAAGSGGGPRASTAPSASVAPPAG